MKAFISYTALVILSIIGIYPALWIVLSSLKTGNSLFSETLIPETFTLEHYRNLFLNTDYSLWFMNSLKIAVISMLIGTLFVLLTSYTISRHRFAGRKITMNMLLVLHMFPGFMAMIAVYILLLQINLLDNHWALILVYSSSAVLTHNFFAKGYFDTLPKSLEEAARIDGAGQWTVFVRIMLPLTRPLLTFVSLMIFIETFSDFIFAQLIIRTEEKRTLAVGLWNMVNSRQSTEFTTFAAGAVLVSIPIVVLFMSLQRFLVAGLTSGANKG
ncbi:sugar ABC transporter permease [Paenibacillus beijingensis]|uniref:Arabinogalactan ABC transporter permease n=1 Tax=Paenibacillus beijingensis TaxID=1126833 RepID=A0A0D5NLV1_9BACL|nr:sugar ABC transporter permease [Paenibacillus beijingensis]AJY75913.1 arabinogalactan ABC transporter permease [Paenibacillus beijingensis]